MKNLIGFVLLFFAAVCFSQTDCTSSNIRVFDSNGLLVSSHTQSYKAETAAILLAQQQGRATVKTPDIVCTSKLSSSSSASIASSSSKSSSSSVATVSSSSATSCAVTSITPFYQINGGGFIQDSSFNVQSGAIVDLSPQPSSGGAWSWSGCGVSSSLRNVTLTASNTCVLTAQYTNACGATSTNAFYVNVSGVTTSSQSSTSSSQVAQNAVLRWQHPTEREDGTLLQLSEIAGYSVRQWNGVTYSSMTLGVVTQTPITGIFQRVEIAVFDTHGLYSAYVTAADMRI